MILIGARYAFDRMRQRPGVMPGEMLQEGACHVVRVIDGDSLVVRQTSTPPGQSQRRTVEATIRLLGIDCPEVDEPWGEEATALARQLTGQRSVTLRFDRRRLDRYERFLAYVFAGDEMLNVRLVEAGFARVDVYPGDSVSIGRRLDQAEQAARASQRGLWGS